MRIGCELNVCLYYDQIGINEVLVVHTIYMHYQFCYIQQFVRIASFAILVFGFEIGE